MVGVVVVGASWSLLLADVALALLVDDGAVACWLLLLLLLMLLLFLVAVAVAVAVVAVACWLLLLLLVGC